MERNYDVLKKTIKNILIEIVKQRVLIEFDKYGGIIKVGNVTVGKFYIMHNLNGHVILDLIKIDENYRGKGYGEEAMVQIINHFKKENKIIALTPSPFESRFSDLIKWYKKLGFIHNFGNNKIEKISQPFYKLP